MATELGTSEDSPVPQDSSRQVSAKEAKGFRANSFPKTMPKTAKPFPNPLFMSVSMLCPKNRVKDIRRAATHTPAGEN